MTIKISENRKWDELLSVTCFTDNSALPVVSFSYPMPEGGLFIPDENGECEGMDGINYSVNHEVVEKYSNKAKSSLGRFGMKVRHVFVDSTGSYVLQDGLCVPPTESDREISERAIEAEMESRYGERF